MRKNRHDGRDPPTATCPPPAASTASRCHYLGVDSLVCRVPRKGHGSPGHHCPRWIRRTSSHREQGRRLPAELEEMKPGSGGGEELALRFRCPRAPARPTTSPRKFLLTPGGPRPTSQLSWAPPGPRQWPTEPLQGAALSHCPVWGQALGIMSRSLWWSPAEPQGPVLTPAEAHPHRAENPGLEPPAPSCSVLLSHTRQQDGHRQAAGAETTLTLGPYGAGTRD